MISAASANSPRKSDEVRISQRVDDAAAHRDEGACGRLRPARRRVVVALCAYPVERRAERGKTGRAQHHGGLHPVFECFVKAMELFMEPAVLEIDDAEAIARP